MSAITKIISEPTAERELKRIYPLVDKVDLTARRWEHFSDEN